MKFISPRDFAIMRRLPKALLAVILVGLWLAACLFLYDANPYVPRWTFATGSRRNDVVVHFADNGKTLIIAKMYDHKITFWDVATGERKRVVEAPGHKELPRIEVLADGRFVQTHYSTGATEVYDAATAQLLLKRQSVAGSIYPPRIAISRDGKHFAEFPNDNRISGCLRSMPADPEGADGEPRIALPAMGYGPQQGFEFAPDGKSLISLFQNDKGGVEFAIVHCDTGKRLHTGTACFSFKTFAWSPDSKRLAVARAKEIAVLDTSTWSEVAVLTLPRVLSTDFAFQPDSRMLVIAEYGVGARIPLRLWDIVSAKNRVAVEMPSDCGGVQFAYGHQKAIAYCSRNRDPDLRRFFKWMGLENSLSFEVRAILYDLSNTVSTTDLPTGTIAVSQDGRAAASVSEQGVITVWDIPPRINYWRYVGLVAMLSAPISLWMMRRIIVARYRAKPRAGIAVTASQSSPSSPPRNRGPSLS